MEVEDSHIGSKNYKMVKFGNDTYGTVLVGDEEMIQKGYFFDNNVQPLYIEMGTGSGLGVVDLLGVISRDNPHGLVENCEDYGVGLKERGDGDDFIGLNTDLRLNLTKNMVMFVLIHGEDYPSGVVQCLGGGKPTPGPGLNRKLEPLSGDLILGSSKNEPMKVWLSGPVTVFHPFMGDEGRVQKGYFFDNVQPFYIEWGTGSGLGILDLLGVINGSNPHGLVENYEDYCVELEEGGAGVDLIGLSTDLRLNPTKNMLTFVLVHGEDCISGVVHCLGGEKPTPGPGLNPKLTLFIGDLILGSLKNEPMKVGLSGPVEVIDPFMDIPVNFSGTKIELKSPIPRSVGLPELPPIPVLLSYGTRPGGVHVYIPSLDRTVENPPLTVDFHRYLLLAVNEDADILLLNPFNKFVLVYMVSEEFLFYLPRLEDLENHHQVVYGCFRRETGEDEFDLEYTACILAFYIGHPGTRVRIHYMTAFQQEYVWHLTELLLDEVPQTPRAPFVMGDFFVWVNTNSGSLCSIRYWDINPDNGEPIVGGGLVAQDQLQFAENVFSVTDGKLHSLIVYSNGLFSVYDVSVNVAVNAGGGELIEWSLTRRLNLNNRNFYCSCCGTGFSTAPFPIGVHWANAIFFGGFRGDCARLDNYAVLDEGLQQEDNVTVLRPCHDPINAEHPLVCRCESAFLLLSLAWLRLILPDVDNILSQI